MSNPNHVGIRLRDCPSTIPRLWRGVGGMFLLAQLLRTARLVYPESGVSGFMARSKYCIRALRYLRATQEWLDLLEHPKLAIITASHPHILTKLQRPYLHRGLSTNARLAVLRQHFGFVARNLARSILLSIYAESGFTLAAFALDQLGRFELRFLYADGFEKEGDLTIGLVNCSSRAVMFSLTFSVTTDARHRRDLFIGGIQGNKLSNERELVVAITRGLHGLRPKALLVFALRQVATQWQVDHIRAVNNGMHIYRHWSYINRRKRKSVTADYDVFWRECGGTQDVDGMFSIPIHVKARALSTLKPNKRPVYRRRYEMLDALARQIASNLSKVSKRPDLSAGGEW